MKIYLIRHGQTTGDVEDRYGGDYDDHLSSLGISQSQDLAKKLEGRNIEIIFSSSLLRAQETAQIVADVLAVPLKIIADLRERNTYGILTGMIISEAREKYPKEYEEVKSYKNTIEGAEEYEKFKERILSAINKIASENYQTVAIVTHGGPIKCFFREVLGVEAGEIGDCEIIELEKNGRYKLIGRSNGKN